MPPIVTRVIASQNTAWTSFFAVTTRIEPPTSRTERARNAASCQSTATRPPPSPDASQGGAEGDEVRREEDREEGERDQPLPAEVQDLVDPDPRDRPRDPDEQEEQQVHLEEEPDLVRDNRDRDHGPADGRREGREHGPGPPAEVEDHNEGGPREGAEPLEPEDEPEPHPRVLREPTLDEFRLRLRDVERDPLHLRHDRDEEHREPDELWNREDVPVRDRDRPRHHEEGLLLVDDVDHVQAPGVHEEGDDREEERDLVRHQLRGGPHAADEAVLVVRCPPRD